MEKAVDVVVARRFKARGMSWLRHGVSALVRLRTFRLSGIWTASSGPWAGGTMRLAHGYETLSGDGLRHGRPAMPGWGAARRGSLPSTQVDDLAGAAAQGRGNAISMTPPRTRNG